jgi:hypothetical protein
MAGFLTPGLTARVFRQARLPIRVRLVRWSIPTATSMNAREWDTVAAHVGPRVVVDGRKWVLDGTPIEQFALQRAAYPGRPDWHGRLEFPIDTMRLILAGALRPGSAPLHLHVVGDSTADLVLGMMEALAPDAAWQARRVRFEHGNGITGSQIARAARKGIVIAQPRSGAPYKSWRAAGIPVAYGSDMLRNPFVHMLAAVTGGEHPEEAISRGEAVRILTSGSAFAERAEGRKGQIVAGQLADVAVLSQDIFTVPVRALPATRSVLTVVGGQIAYDALTPGGAMREPAYAESASSGARPGPGTPSELHDAIATVLGIPSLAAVALPSGARELRISTGSGMVYGWEYPIVRIVLDSTGARGEVWRYRGQRDSSGTGRFIVRRVVPRPRPDWAQIMARLDTLGADTLAVPQGGVTWADAGELLLESRRGADYRSVAINAPTHRTGEAARRAAVVAALIDSLGRASAR